MAVLPLRLYGDWSRAYALPGDEAGNAAPFVPRSFVALLVGRRIAVSNGIRAIMV